MLAIPGNKIMLISIPNFAASKVPAVVGDTNLFKDICCIISPLMLKPTPASIKATVLGILLIKKTDASESFQFVKSNQLICFTPMDKEAMIKTEKSKTKNRFRKISLFRLILINANVLIRLILNKEKQRLNLKKRLYIGAFFRFS